MPTIKLKSPKPDISEKRCRVCGEVKPVKEFIVRSESFDGYETDCRECTNARKRREKADRKLRSIYKGLTS